MKKRGLAALAVCLGLGGAAMADDAGQPGVAKKSPANAQGVVPITQFMEAPEFPFAPKPKPSLWKRFYRALTNPFAKDEPKMTLPPGTVPTPGALPTVGSKPKPETTKP